MSDVPDYYRGQTRGLGQLPIAKRSIDDKPTIDLNKYLKTARANLPKKSDESASLAAISDQSNSNGSYKPSSTTSPTDREFARIQRQRKELEKEQQKIIKEKELRKKAEELERQQELLETELSDSGIKKFLKRIGYVNIAGFFTYSILLIIFFVIVKPSFIYDYPEPKPQGECKYQYCIEGACADMSSQDLRNSVREGMRQLNYGKLAGWFFGLWIGLIILHFFIAKVGILDIGTKRGRCYNKPLGC